MEDRSAGNPYESFEKAVGGDQPLAQFASCFEKTAKRWEVIVYPAMFAFCVLAIYGGYLIYSMTTDMSHIARNIQIISTSMDPYMGPHLASLVDGVQEMSDHVQLMSGNLQAMDQNMEVITANLKQITKHMEVLEPMMASMDNMDQSTERMTDTIYHMTREIDSMNHGLSPDGMFSRFMPF